MKIGLSKIALMLYIVLVLAVLSKNVVWLTGTSHGIGITFHGGWLILSGPKNGVAITYLPD